MIAVTLADIAPDYLLLLRAAPSKVMELDPGSPRGTARGLVGPG
jgi:hypothetical protein